MSASFASASSECLQITSHADLRPGGNFYVGAWVQFTTSLTDNGVVQTYADNGNVQGWLLSIASNVVRLRSGRNTGGILGTDYQQIVGTTTLNTGAWFYLFGWYNGSTLKVFVNGTEEGSVSWTNAAGYGTVYPRVGCRNNSGTDIQFFDGKIGEVRFWNGGTMTVDMIKDEMRSLQPVHNISNLKLWLPLDNASLPAAYSDQSGNAHDATPINTPTVAQSPPF